MHPNLDVSIFEFEYTPEPLRFRIAPDVFEAAPQLPSGALELAMKIDGAGDKSARLELLLGFFDEILTEESAKQFRERARSKTNTIGLKLMMDVLYWLLEKYGLRPTQPLSPSLTE